MSTVAVDKPAGLQLMELIAAGAVAPPPAARLLGLEIDDVSEGAVTFGFTADDRFSNGAATHGGILAAVADFALSTAVLTALDAGADVVTTNLAVTYLRPVALTGRYRCAAKVVHRGRTLAHADAVMTDEAGRQMVRATGAFHIGG